MQGQRLSIELWLPCNCMLSAAGRPRCTGPDACSAVEFHPVREDAVASVLGQRLPSQDKGVLSPQASTCARRL